ncbi:nucleoporin protein Ndc1-Nup [Kalaharituber pfeilii]|nr:nucleoporin protein Ndc1-Nup [Kalaharituber pfeilii]
MVSSISRSIPSPPPRPSPPSYHHYVSSLLHRRWIRTCVVLYLVCYAEAWLVTTKRHVLWSIFSAAPAKALLVWFCSMPVLIMRIQLVHLGAKSRPSAAHDVGHRLGSFNTYAAALAYMFSAWTFVVLYMFTSDHGDNGDDLGITTSVDGRSYERPRLNERFLYLLFLSLWTGIVHTVYHLSTDKDRVDLPPVSKQEGKGVAVQAGKQALFTAVSGMFAYLFVRKSAWRYTLRVARLFFRISTIPEPYSWPVGILFFIRTLWITLLIFMMWETAHAAFHLYFTMEPLKDGQVLSEGSADPNGTLVTGFKQRNKPFTQVQLQPGCVNTSYMLANLGHDAGNCILGVGLHYLQPTFTQEELLHGY